MYYIYFHNWWPGFFTKQDANNIGFFEKLLSYTKLKNYQITNDLKIANVLIEAGKPVDGLINNNWKIKINFIGEPVFPDYDKYDIVLTGVNRINNIVDLPLSVMYIHGNNFLNTLEKRQINRAPSQFCSFIVSNPKCETRNKMFHMLNQYKKVNSAGRHLNNMGKTLPGTWSSSNHFEFISQHKFMICFENTKMETYSTEKIVNAYLGNTIPIYWASEHIKNIFNEESMLFLEDETEESFNKLIEKIIELDTNDEKYMEFINRPVFNEKNKEYWKEHYILEKLGEKIDKKILDRIPDCEKEVTLFITSCGRPNLLKTTLESFVKYNTYPIKSVILCEDSGIQGIVDFAKDILPYPIEFCYNKERIGQMKTIEKYIKLVETPYVFHLEDDFEFFDYGFIEHSFQILNSDNNISQVLLEDEQHDYYKVDIGNPLCYKILTNDPAMKNSNYGDGALNVFSWRPSLKKKDIAILRIPYEPWDDEYTIELQINKLGKYAVITKNIKNGKKGFCTHIGKENHVRNLNGSKKILGRADFPDKREIRLKDI